MRKYPKNILIIRLSSIGDIVLTTPLIGLLRKNFPKAEIDFVVKQQYVDLVKYNPDLNTIYVVNPDKGFKDLKRIKKQIKRKQYGLLIDIHKNFRSIYLRLFSGARIKKMYRKRRFIRTLLVLFKINKYNKVIPVYKAYLNTIEDFDINLDDGKLEFFIPDEVQVKVNKYLLENDYTEKNNIITLCIGAGFYSKRWLPEYFAELINLIYQHKLGKVIVLGDETDIQTAKNIKNSTKYDFLNLCGKFNLIESAALLNSSNLVISNDTGLMHIAQALKKNIIAIFGSTTKELGYFPVNENSIVIEKDLDCRPCSHNGKNKCPKKHFKCIKEIYPEEVLENIKKFS